MIIYENHCVGCPPEMGCMGSACKLMNVPVLICDECGEEYEKLYWYGKKQLCEYCYADNMIKEAEEVEVETL